MNKLTTNRRRFIGTAGTTGLFQIVPRHVLGGPNYTSPSEKLNIAGIGVGGMGHANMLACAKENIVALCDVDHKYAAKSFEAFPKAAVYKDYRVMFEKQKDIDAVLIATPDHTHAVISMAAMQSGKHVFCQKPLTHDIYESRMLAKAAKEAGVVTQMGIQGHSQEGLRLICEWIWDGAIGDVSEVDAWCSLMYSPPGHAFWSSILQDRPKQGQSVPSGLDWDRWIGPAAMREYHRCYHPGSWRCWWDFGCGMMGDRGAHTLDSVFTALKLGAPSSIEGSGIVGGNAEVHPDKAKVTYLFPARDGFPALKLNWYEGQEPPRPKELEEGRNLHEQGGVIFKGDKGIIMCGVYGNSPRLIPETAMRAYKRPAKTLPRIKGSHEGNWINAIKSGTKASADFSYSGPLTELALLGNIAKRFPNRKLDWDNENMKVTNFDDANAWVRRPYRAGWSL
ncbi:Gfo/Idh/MocA family protein [Haloferula rosea]|uniref:Gfo/Idh/MocA family oxidoreductase n=1 Tax=Haloferula rosea TaxID=490093 RepID=A0A934RI99_9BACT|nr:Gfo/Idh/MocA family oxidoreductase [Haloferula rosea]MBK1829011.1 Gfo/Idh/MocA family oxidoreductase [Haloferula rosea]